MTPDGFWKDFPFTALTAITPLDGRYRKKLVPLANFFSEYALIKVRTEIEIRYLVSLSENNIIRKFTAQEKNLLQDYRDNFSLEDAEDVKKIEEVTRHDVKAMERHLRDKLMKTSLKDVMEMVHFGLTSEDVNNLSHRLLLTRSRDNVILPALKNICRELTARVKIYRSIPMLARTHGQPAVPTTLGKELAVFAVRLNRQIVQFEKLTLTGKLNGAVGNFNAHMAGYPKINWMSFSEKFVRSLGFSPNLVTTQINTYDDIAEFFQVIQRINVLLIDFDQDTWRLVSDGWLKQEVKKGEVGSSTMPQKVNPIDFENSEGNLGLANSLFGFFINKLPISRLQRDLSDSTVTRSFGTALGYSLLAYESLLVGLSRVAPDTEAIEEALSADWSILTEAVQTILRRDGVADPYSLVASLTHGKRIDRNGWEKWLNKLSVPDKTLKELTRLTPENYIGLSEKIVDEALREISRG